MGIVVHSFFGIHNPDQIQKFHDFGIEVVYIGPMESNSLRDLIANRKHWIQRCAWFLKNIGNFSASNRPELPLFHLENIAAFPENLPGRIAGGRGGKQSCKGERRHAFATAAFANNCQRLTSFHRKRALFHGVGCSGICFEIDDEVANFEQVISHELLLS